MSADLKLIDITNKAGSSTPLLFIKGNEAVEACQTGTSQIGSDGLIRKIQESMAEAMGAKNVAFLLGSGCSSCVKDGQQLGVPTMQPLADEFTKTIGGRNDPLFLNATERNILKTAIGINLNKEPYSNNLESLMEVLYSWKFSLNSSSHPRHSNLLKSINRIIGKLKRFLFERCSAGEFSKNDSTVQELYESFYRKLIYRDRSLPRPWVFTTNYDLFNETAMDRLGLPYSNGFSGTIERRFNPSVFRYALAEQLDLSSRKWSAVDGFVYLCKLHGSISWVEDKRGLFPVREMQTLDKEHESLMIYPTPAKQASSFSAPYSDLFREFQSRIVQEQTVLFVIGYGFGDQHINNIIYQALTVPTFRLVIFSNPNNTGELSKLRALKDPRVWIIGGVETSTNRNAHFFDFFVDSLMPELPSNLVEKAVAKVVTDLMGRENTSTI